MAKTVKATKTVNPLHFEDLEPHRFEDLVRRLLYGFREWSNIEATGRGGSDEGFDVRAWEKSDAVTNVSEEGEEGARSFDGKLWQIQGKRERTITPAKMRSYIKDGVDGKHPPYGYILAAATNITKASFDAYREELKKKGVREFYFWGKDYLEDQLALPQNDEILFTFFGLSLSPRRRSRVTEIKFNINNKNKIQKLLFGSEAVQSNVPRHKSFLLRDIKDTHYPDSTQHPDFEKHRRWEEHDAVHVTPTGTFFKVREWYAYLDKPKKLWDFTRAVDLTPRKHNIDAANRARLKDSGKKAERYWRHLPLWLQARFVFFGFVRFEDMLIIDDKGDAENTDPHIFVDFGQDGPFSYITANLQQGHYAIHGDDLSSYTKKDIFPSVFPDAKKGAVHELATFVLPEQVTRNLQYLSGSSTLYAFDGKMDAVAEGDMIHIPAKDQNSSEKHAEITNVRNMTMSAILKEHGTDNAYWRQQLKEHAGRDINDADHVRACEMYSVMLSTQGDLLYYLEPSRY
jgi:hypothetical protein